MESEPVETGAHGDFPVCVQQIRPLTPALGHKAEQSEEQVSDSAKTIQAQFVAEALQMVIPEMSSSATFPQNKHKLHLSHPSIDVCWCMT
ncbi:hypothetical protein Q8A67_020313 [Cirrhinus molitorella]|uniref:Uncharacterized protein n=1 Tax=Cirrhinus molitorella TaxID=172907 RepID=A0AA88TNK2_9TELE|nr:hypothetical protein Q8A67_020313 [Cirrhinus molitorella]